ncbi:Cytochrome domain of cellobiose dehydrogenase [Microdochium nivale]|nr:Cytochrome domain of cellobiose dehydrogenase [Microdochium nivale]
MAKTWGQRALLALATLNISLLPALAAAQSNSSTNNTNSTSSVSHGALFFTPSRNLAFALSIPADKTSQDIYFSMVMTLETMWGAVGLGSASMSGALMFVMHGSASGQNVTLSPRIASDQGHSEPWYAPDISIEALPGNGGAPIGRVAETAWVYSGVCRNCRSWITPGSGARRGIDVVSTRQDMIYATGEVGDIWSDDLNYPLRVHKTFGSFTMDMTRAAAAGTPGSASASPPVIDLSDRDPELVGTARGAIAVDGYRDRKGVAHAIIMVLCFVGLFPFGAFVLRLGGWVRAHAVLQVLACVMFIIGASLGMSISGMYNRTRKYNSAHQIIGLLVFIFVFGQFALGFLHHRGVKKTQQKTKLAPIHVWLGRLIIVLGLVNAFLGFTLSQAVFYNYILTGLILAVFPFFAVVLLAKRWFSNRGNKKNQQSKNGEDSDGAGADAGYNLEPWRMPQQQQQQQQAGAGHAGYSASATGQGFAPQPLQPPPAYQGTQQSAREYV